MRRASSRRSAATSRVISRRWIATIKESLIGLDSPHEGIALINLLNGEIQIDRSARRRTISRYSCRALRIREMSALCYSDNLPSSPCRMPARALKVLRIAAQEVSLRFTGKRSAVLEKSIASMARGCTVRRPYRSRTSRSACSTVLAQTVWASRHSETAMPSSCSPTRNRSQRPSSLCRTT
jgi:hypothetical protein